MDRGNTKLLLDQAALFALRARGYAEPNPLVGALVVKDGRIIGRGHHRRFGEAHAEVEAITDCGRNGDDPRGGTLYVTLEPCNHFGKQPPCSKAIIEAGLARVIIARADPNPVSSGGADVLQRAGVAVEFSEASELGARISDPFIKRVTSGLPWVIAKWAQTPEGQMTTPATESRWISNEHSRRRVHRLRARVDAVVTGIGTVLSDDPLLNTRDVRIRRTARRVVLDTNLRMKYDSALVRTAGQAPVLIFCDADRLQRDGEMRSKSIVLASAGITVHGIPRDGEHLDLRAALGNLSDQYQATNILLEAGPRLLRAFLGQKLADELLVYVGQAPAGFKASPFSGFTLTRTRAVGDDLEVQYQRA